MKESKTSENLSDAKHPMTPLIITITLFDEGDSSLGVKV